MRNRTILSSFCEYYQPRVYYFYRLSRHTNGSTKWISPFNVLFIYDHFQSDLDLDLDNWPSIILNDYVHGNVVSWNKRWSIDNLSLIIYDSRPFSFFLEGIFLSINSMTMSMVTFPKDGEFIYLSEENFSPNCGNCVSCFSKC